MNPPRPVIGLLAVVVLTGCGARTDRAVMPAGPAGVPAVTVTPDAAPDPPPSAPAESPRSQADAVDASSSPSVAAAPAAASPEPAPPAAPQRVAAAPAAAAHIPVPPRANYGGAARSTPPEGLVLTLALAGDRIARGGTITGTWTMRNSTDQPIRLTACECAPVVGLYRNGEYVAGLLPGHGAAVPPEDTVLAPGQTVTQAITLDAADRRQDTDAPRPLPSGTYDAAADIVVSYNQALFTPTVTVTVE